MFEKLELAPADPILGLTEAFKQDPNPNKINLGVGVYKDASGKTPVLAAVKAAEAAVSPFETYLADLEARLDQLRAQGRQAQQLAGLGTAAAMIAHASRRRTRRRLTVAAVIVLLLAVLGAVTWSRSQAIAEARRAETEAKRAEAAKGLDCTKNGQCNSLGDYAALYRQMCQGTGQVAGLIPGPGTGGGPGGAWEGAASVRARTVAVMRRWAMASSSAASTSSSTQNGLGRARNTANRSASAVIVRWPPESPRQPECAR